LAAIFTYYTQASSSDCSIYTGVLAADLASPKTSSELILTEVAKEFQGIIQRFAGGIAGLR
jgi:hypothetical protein